MKSAIRVSGHYAVAEAETDAERKNLMQELFSEVYFRGYSVTAFMIAPGLLPSNGGESFPGLEGIISLAEPFSLIEPEEPLPQG